MNRLASGGVRVSMFHNEEAKMRKSLAVAGALVMVALMGCGDAEDDASPQKGAGANVAAEGAVEAGPGLQVQTTAVGDVITDQTGRTLYAFVPDAGGAGSCTAECEAAWPPFLADKLPDIGMGVDKAAVKLLPRDGGVSQVQVGKWPLYLYVADMGPGDLDGQGEEGGEWWAVAPDGALVKKMPAR
jgi:predicted lipoprotein with Yx(FWY)xxD motif